MNSTKIRNELAVLSLLATAGLLAQPCSAQQKPEAKPIQLAITNTVVVAGHESVRIFDSKGKITGAIGQNASALAPTEAETAASLRYIRRGAKPGSKLATKELSYSSTNNDLNPSKPEFWLKSETIDAYCDGVLGAAQEVADKQTAEKVKQERQERRQEGK